MINCFSCVIFTQLLTKKIEAKLGNCQLWNGWTINTPANNSIDIHSEFDNWKYRQYFCQNNDWNTLFCCSWMSFRLIRFRMLQNYRWVSGWVDTSVRACVILCVHVHARMQAITLWIIESKASIYGYCEFSISIVYRCVCVCLFVCKRTDKHWMQ